MRALIVYESMYGNTHIVADRIAEGLRGPAEAEGVEGVEVVSVHDVTAGQVAHADLFVIGGPTHIHGMTSTRSRGAAVEAAAKTGADLVLEVDAEGPGLRDWFANLGPLTGRSAVAFDTRIDAPSLVTGRASKAIARRMRDHGMHLLVPAESFLVDKQNKLIVGEGERAQRWGSALAAKVPVSA